VLDEPLFGGLCTTLAFVAEAHALLLKEGIVVDQTVGNGGRRVAKHPAAQIYRDMMGLAQRLAREFGLSYSARELLALSLGEPMDELERIINGK